MASKGVVGQGLLEKILINILKNLRFDTSNRLVCLLDSATTYTVTANSIQSGTWNTFGSISTTGLAQFKSMQHYQTSFRARLL
jgi:hypothetical protein